MLLSIVIGSYSPRSLTDRIESKGSIDRDKDQIRARGKTPARRNDPAGENNIARRGFLQQDANVIQTAFA